MLSLAYRRLERRRRKNGVGAGAVIKPEKEILVLGEAEGRWR